MIGRVLVSDGECLYVCAWGDGGALCGKCGREKVLLFHAGVWSTTDCPACGARIEEIRWQTDYQEISVWSPTGCPVSPPWLSDISGVDDARARAALNAREKAARAKRAP